MAPLRNPRFWSVLAAGFVLGQVLPVGCNWVASGERDAVSRDGSVDTVRAQERNLEVSGSCNRGEILVYDNDDVATCAEIDELEFPRCSTGEFLAVDPFGEIECQRVLPDCNRGDILVSAGSQGFRCEELP